ncbi:MAG: DUF362 domain-containing protein [Victivallales bacterium]|jgi:uncharacterized protein (DUF362 family)/NAD-dependent dihydropyrimidine dehydrogenase PreA subunit
MNTTVSAVICESYGLPLLEAKIRLAVELAGGWPAKLKPGANVLLKPNLLSARTPEQCVTTHPELVRAVIRELRRKGVDKITVADSPAGNYPWDELWEKTGMRKIADEEKVELIPVGDFVRKEVPGYGNVPVLKELGSFDVFISLPKLKTHLLTKMTGAVKNSYGLVVGEAKSGFHGKCPSPRKMADFLASVYGIVRPDFVIMDAVESMAGDGPAAGFPFKSGLIFAGADAVAVDSCACAVYGYTAREIPILVKAESLGFGTASPELIEKNGDGWEKMKNMKAKRSISDTLHRFPEPAFKILTMLLRCRPRIKQDTCVKCGKCFKVCSQKAVEFSSGRYSVDSGKCILCMCCIEACPVKAIELRYPAQRIMDIVSFFRRKK